MSSSIEDKVTLTARCLCKANVFEAEVTKAQLPLQAHSCHCDSCRHMTGALYSTCIESRWPVPKAEVDTSKLKVFYFTSSVDLLFCPTCSTPIFFVTKKDREEDFLQVFTGVLQNDAVDLVKFTDNIFVHDTLDGGASVWFKHNPDGSDIKSFATSKGGEQAEEITNDWPPPTSLTGYEAKKEESVPIRCKCKGVDLVLHRGDYSKVEESDLPSNIDPKTHKLDAILCACNSCRLQSGVDVFTWTYSDMKYISFSASDKEFPNSKDKLKRLVDAKDPDIGALTYYQSSKDVERYFCSNCSACIFYAVDDREHLIDVAVGVLNASDGARAEGMLSWSYGARLGFREDGEGGWRDGLYDIVQKDAEEYRISRGYPKNWKRIAKDENGGRTPDPTD
jgi:hypothetical protein